MVGCDYDIAIAGGGVAGLSAAILLSHAGYRTILIEKQKYPYHKVCGEYISIESLNFLKYIGFDSEDFNLPVIKKLKISANNNFLETRLPLGGIGVSRYFLDEKLMVIASNNGTAIMDETQINNIFYNNEYFKINTNRGELTARVVLGAFGKRSNLDKHRINKSNYENNYIGVKYHVKADLPADQIELHIFKNGYCGISKVEGNDTYCLCYMTSARNLKDNNNKIELLEKNILYKNKWLKNYFSQFEKQAEFPVTISQIQLGAKVTVENHMLIIGDAAGTIAPLCGNGMSMAFHSAYVASNLVDEYLREKYSYKDMLIKYNNFWKRNFASRIYVGKILQKLFLNVNAASIAIGVLKNLPPLHNPLIKLTHGKSFINKGQTGVPVR